MTPKFNKGDKVRLVDAYDVWYITGSRLTPGDIYDVIDSLTDFHGLGTIRHEARNAYYIYSKDRCSPAGWYCEQGLAAVRVRNKDR